MVSGASLRMATPALSPLGPLLCKKGFFATLSGHSLFTHQIGAIIRHSSQIRQSHLSSPLLKFALFTPHCFFSVICRRSDHTHCKSPSKTYFLCGCLCRHATGISAVAPTLTAPTLQRSQTPAIPPTATNRKNITALLCRTFKASIFYG